MKKLKKKRMLIKSDDILGKTNSDEHDRTKAVLLINAQN